MAGISIWLLLAALLLLLGAVCIWMIFGRIDTRLQLGSECRDGILTCYIEETDRDVFTDDIKMEIDGKEYMIQEISKEPMKAKSVANEYAMHVAGLREKDWVYLAKAEADLPDGVYQVSVLTESVHPFSFLVN